MAEIVVLNEFDALVLRALCACPASGTATYVIKNTLRMKDWGFDLKTNTGRVLRSLRRLEKDGYVRRIRTSYAVMISWAATESGRGLTGIADPVAWTRDQAAKHARI